MRLLVFIVGLAFLARGASAQPAELIADIESTQTNAGFVAYPTSLGGLLYFSGNAGEDSGGDGVFSYDPASGAVVRVADLNPDSPSNGGANDLTALGGKLYFAGIHPATGMAGVLWVYDPATDTAEIADPSADVFNAINLEPVGGRLFFTARTSNEGAELFAYDPATAQVTLAVDIAPGSDSSSPSELTAFGGALYFSASDPTAGRELFRHDPASGATTRLTDLVSGIGGSLPFGRTQLSDGRERYAAIGSTLYLAAQNSTSGFELFAFDTASGTLSLAADIAPGSAASDPAAFTVLDGRVYVAADDGTSGRELWSYDPGTGTAALAADIVPGAASSAPGRAFGAGQIGSGGGILASGGALYFEAFAESERELWVYTPASGARLINVDEEADPAPDVPDSSSPRFLTEFGGRIYFAADVGETGMGELYSYDPSADAVALAADVNQETIGSAPANFVVTSDGAAYFSAFTRREGRELWGYTPARGAFLAADIVPGNGLNDGATDVSSSPEGLVAVGEDVYFVIFTDDVGRELWLYDTSEGEARVAVDLNPGPASGAQSGGTSGGGRRPVTAGGRVYFFGTSPSGSGIYEYDPASGAATAVSQGAGQISLSAADGAVYFAELGGSSGLVLQRYTPGAAAPEAVSDLDEISGTRFGEGSPLVVSGGALYGYAGSTLGAGTSFQGLGLWRVDLATGDAREVSRVDGTGTARAQPYLNNAFNQARNQTLAAVGGVVFFRGRPASGAARELELRAYFPDGDSLSTIDINPQVEENGPDPDDDVFIGSIPDVFRVFDGMLYVAANADGTNDIYAVDPGPTGMPNPTLERVLDVFPGAEPGEAMDVFTTGYAALDRGVIAGATAGFQTGTELVGAGLGTSSAPEAPRRSPLAVDVWPNPVRGRATVRVALAADAPARVGVYDALGREVAVLHDGPLASGTHTLQLDANRLATGLYIVRLASGERVGVQRLTVVR